MEVVAIKKDTYPRRLFVVLYLGGILGALAVLPFAFELFGSAISASGPPPDVPLPLLITIGAVQNLLILALIVGFGLKLARRLGLGAPLLESWLYKKPSQTTFAQTLKIGLIAGGALGIVLTAALLYLAPILPNLPFVAAAKIAVWKRLLACFYGGLYEELLTRLLLLSLFGWLLSRGWRKVEVTLSAKHFWVANVFVAVLFGLGHLPSASLVMPITPLVVAVALLLNGVAAVTFGYLYWKRGLEASMVAHFTVDFVLYVIGPVLLKG